MPCNNNNNTFTKVVFQIFRNLFVQCHSYCSDFGDVRLPGLVWLMVLNATFNNISVI